MNEENRTVTIEKNNLIAKNIDSFMISLLLMSSVIMVFLSTHYGISVKLSAYGIASVMFLFFCIRLFLIRNIRCSVGSVIFIILIVALVLLSKIYLKEVNYSIFQLFFYLIIPIIIAQQIVDFKQVIFQVMIISIPLVFGLDDMLVLDNVGLHQADMYNIYSFIPTIGASIVYLLFYYKRSSKMNLVLLLNVYYLYRVVSVATRGVWLVVIVFCVCILIYVFKEKVSRNTYYFLILLGMGLALGIVFKFNTVITTSVYYLEKIVGSDFGFVVKTKRLLAKGDISNGRMELWKNIWKFIRLNPVTGYGIEATSRLTSNKYPYPHNFMLQLILDCGLIGTYPIWIFIKMMISYVKKEFWDIENNIQFIYFFSISIPIVFLSCDVWKFVSFWIFIGFGIRMTKKPTQRSTN